MARKLIQYIELIDDFDPNSPADETVEIAIDGTVYELDLQSVRAKEIREFLAPFQQAAHDHWKMPPRPKKKRKGVTAQALTEVPKPNDGTATAAKAADKEARNLIRAWLRENDWDLASTGKIPVEALTEFMEANPEAYVPATTLKDAGLA